MKTNLYFFFSRLTVRRGPRFRLSLALPLSLAGIVLLWLAITFVHGLAMVVASNLLALLTNWSLIQSLVVASPGDPIHGLLALQMLGDLKGSQIAFTGPLGDMLASFMPFLFTSAEDSLISDAWFGTVFASGSSPFAINVVYTAVNILFIIVGVFICSFAGKGHKVAELGTWPRWSRMWYCTGLLFITYGTLAQVQGQWAGAGGWKIALSMVATKILNVEASVYDQVMDNGGQFVLAAGNLLAALLAFICSILFVVQANAWPIRPRLADEFRRVPSRCKAASAWVPFTCLAAIVLFETPIRAVPTFESAPVQAAEAPADIMRNLSNRQNLAITAPETPIVEESHYIGVSHVSISQGPEGFEYRLDGQSTRLRCIGYNSISQGESPDERAARYDRDFTLMRNSGVNTVVGWKQDEFDDLLLQSAASNGLGVIVPFELSATVDYTNQSVKSALLEQIASWVSRYKNNPALRMWGLGNEVIHSIGTAQGPKATAFAQFLIDAADQVHRLDSKHPVIYRGAEDVYLEPVAKALAKGGIERPWFVYGMNFYTYRLKDAVEKGPATKIKQPLLISEFAPAGLRPADRPDGYKKQWDIIRTHPQQVLGGCAYVYSTIGPEPLDRTFGLTNGSGVPVDGSLSAIAAEFIQEKSKELVLRAQSTSGSGQPLLVDSLKTKRHQTEIR